MSITFACESCNKSFVVKDEMAGRTGKCSACGTPMRIPMPLVPEVVAASVERSPILSAVSAPTSVQVVVNHEGGKSANGLGVAGVVLAILALLVSWIPVVNLIVVPMALLGGVLALVGLVVASTSKKSGVGWPITGMSLNASAVVIMLVVNSLLAAATVKVAKVVVKQAKEDAAAREVVKKDRNAIVLKAVDAMRKSSAESFGTDVSQRAKITAEVSGIKDFGEGHWEVTGHYEGSDQDGKDFQAPWKARISFLFGSLQCMSVTLGERQYPEPPAKPLESPAVISTPPVEVAPEDPPVEQAVQNPKADEIYKAVKSAVIKAKNKASQKDVSLRKSVQARETEAGMKEVSRTFGISREELSLIVDEGERKERSAKGGKR